MVRQVLDACQYRGSRDNMTITLVRFDAQKPNSEKEEQEKEWLNKIEKSVIGILS